MPNSRFFRRLFVLLALILTSPLVTAHESRPERLDCESFLNAGLLDPHVFLPRAARSADYTLYLDRDHFTDDGYVFIELSRKGERIGRIVSTSAHRLDGYLPPGTRVKNVAIIHNVILHSRYQGKKLGLLMYLTLARELYKKGYLLMKSFDTSAAADNMWDGLVARGLAIKVRENPERDYLYFFNPRVLAGRGAWKPLDGFIKQHEESE